MAPIATVTAWLAGFAVYEWLSPTHLLGLADHITPPFDSALGATLPAFIVAGLVRLAWPTRS